MPIAVCNFQFGMMSKPDSKTARQQDSVNTPVTGGRSLQGISPAQRIGIALTKRISALAETISLSGYRCMDIWGQNHLTITMKAAEPMFVAELEQRQFETAKQVGATIVFEIECRAYTNISCQRQLSAKGCVKEYGQ